MNNNVKFPSWTDIFVMLGACTAIFMICSLLLALLLGTESVSEGFGTFLGYSVMFAATSVVVFFYSKHKLPSDVQLIKVGFGRVNFAVILWALILMLTIGVVIEPLTSLFPEKYLKSIMDVLASGGWGIVVTVICAPLLEEFLFRGMIQGMFTYKYGPWRGILISAAVFGIIHIIPQQVIGAFFLGLVLAYVYFVTSSLVNVVILHMLNNALAYVLTMVTDDPLMSTREMLGNDTIYYITYGISCIVVIISIVGIMLAVKGRAARIEEKNEMKAAAQEDKVTGVDTTNEK